MSDAFVSVVTPFYNTEAYLAECIESVLAQTFGAFEYLLVNNCSTDGSRAIAASFADRDPRVRLVDNSVFLGQVENYNGALALISPRSRYVKMVQADDFIFPECLAQMVRLADTDPSIGLVSSYYLEGEALRGEGLPYSQSSVDGRELCRLQVLKQRFLMGSPSVVLYRADLVRSRQPFFAVGRYHEDTEAAYEILRSARFGFVHQLLSYLRVEPGSTIGRSQAFNPYLLAQLIVLEAHGRHFLSPAELQRELHRLDRAYLRYLARSLLRFRSREFWEYHRVGLASVGRTLPRGRLLAPLLAEMVDTLLNPKLLVDKTVAKLRLPQ